jgi:hypothetical protein
MIGFARSRRPRRLGRLGSFAVRIFAKVLARVVMHAARARAAQA